MHGTTVKNSENQGKLCISWLL